MLAERVANDLVGHFPVALAEDHVEGGLAADELPVSASFCLGLAFRAIINRGPIERPLVSGRTLGAH